jgi:hypothetical protein
MQHPTTATDRVRHKNNLIYLLLFTNSYSSQRTRLASVTKRDQYGTFTGTVPASRENRTKRINTVRGESARVFLKSIQAINTNYHLH